MGVGDRQFGPGDHEQRAAGQESPAEVGPGGQVRADGDGDPAHDDHDDQAHRRHQQLGEQYVLVGAGRLTRDRGPDDLGDREGERADLQARIARVKVNEPRAIMAVVGSGEQQAAAFDEEDPGDAAVPGQDGEPGCRPG